MPNPSEQQRSVTRNGDIGLAATVDNPQDAGSIDPRAPQLDDAAGEASKPSQPFSRQAVFDLLSQALSTEESAGTVPVAARVAGLMRQLDPAFTQETSGYPTFRALLRDAEKVGLLTLIDRGGTSDIAVLAAGSQLEVEAGASSAGRIKQVRPDIWRAFIDWSRPTSYWYDRRTKRLHPITEAAVGPHGVEIPSVSRELQVEWMNEFAGGVRDSTVKAILDESLAAEDPVRGFSAALRNDEASSRRWKRYLKQRVLDRATSWAVSNDIALSEIEASAGAPVSDKIGASNAETGSHIRSEILAVLALLPTSELLRLPIPVEYALKR